MKRIALVILILVALAGGAFWLFPGLLNAARTMIAGVPARGPGPGIAITCAGNAGKGGFIGFSKGEPAGGGIMNTKAQMRFVSEKADAGRACELILEVAKSAKMRTVRERLTTIVIYGANLDATNTTEIDLKVERF